MSTIQVLDKKFSPSIKADEILTHVRRVASEINKVTNEMDPQDISERIQGLFD